VTRKLVGVKVFAPAKVNLALHVTGQRSDGYHLLDSLVAFAGVADDLWIQIGNTISLTTEGPTADKVPADMNNLILKTAALFQELPGASFLLTKHLPVSAGIGGGSADAAAAFRGLVVFWSDGEVDFAGYDIMETPMGQKLAALGADIPMCLRSASIRATGVGDELSGFVMPKVPAVLVNPRVDVSTPEVFQALVRKTNDHMPELPAFSGLFHLVDWLQDQRNDLQDAAISLCPPIQNVLRALDAGEDCLLARMSGSGATCFGLYETKEKAEAAAMAIRAQYPQWWVVETSLGDQSKLASPQIVWDKVE